MIPGVYLIGAGPGDRELITVRGRNILAACDIVFYDNLANPLLLSETKPDCVKVYVGKKAKHHTYTQEKINLSLHQAAREHAVVARLKGGDPYVFGRGSEEAEYLIKRGVHVEVVPGISSSIGGLATAGIPITARNIATSFHVITGHTSADSDYVNYDALAALKGTLVFLMGVSNMANIVDKLLAGGKSADTEVAVIYKASTPEQRVYTGTLTTIVEVAKREQIKPPSLIVVGDVVAFTRTIYQADKRPLSGARIVVTRATDRLSKFSDQLLALGASVVPMPTIRFEAINHAHLQAAIVKIADYAGIVFTSAVAVEVFFKALFSMERDVRCLAGIDIVVAGRETAKALLGYGVRADRIPDNYSQQGILDLFRGAQYSDCQYLLPRSARSQSTWLDELSTYIKPIVLDCYTTLTDTQAHWDESLVARAQYITFTSSSTVEGFLEKLTLAACDVSALLSDKKLVAIGASTKRCLEANGLKADIVAPTATIDSMVQCIVDDYTEVSNE